MRDVPWYFASVTAQARAVRTGEITSAALVTAHLQRLEAINPALNALVQATGERALEAAHFADQQYALGAPLGPLHGVPMTLKDSLDTAGIITTAGDPERAAYVPTEDATVVKRLKAAGAILLGKTNTPWLTLSFETSNRVYGCTHNPYDLQRSAGGSSGGAAALVAAGGSPFDIGSDTGGSIRQPAHNCGVVGLKPTSGRVPRTGHVISFEGHLERLTQLGPITRYVEDIELLLPIIAGPDQIDPAIIPMPWRSPSDVDLSSLRVLCFAEGDDIIACDDVADALQAAANSLRAAGATLTWHYPMLISEAEALFDSLFGLDNHQWIQRLRCQHRADKEAYLAALRTQPGGGSAAEMTALLEQWQRYQSRMLQAFEGYDLLLCPPFTRPALRHEDVHDETSSNQYSWLNAFNLAGFPAGVVRVGSSAEGLPIGVQLVATPWREDIILAAAAHLEQQLGGWQPPDDALLLA